VLSALPVVNLGNACCCLWVICGGVLGAYLDQQNDPRPMTVGRGAFTGLVAGIIGSLVWLIVSIVVNLLMAPLQRRLADDFARMRATCLPEVRTMLESFGAESVDRSGLWLYRDAVLRRRLRDARRRARRSISSATTRRLRLADRASLRPCHRRIHYPDPPMADQKVLPEIADLLQEDRTFEPSASFRAHANVRDEEVYARAARDPEAFWAGFAEELEWFSPWSRVLEWKPPHAKWFVGGTLNASVNCVDRHVRGARRNKAALVWEGEPGDRRTLTYFDLYRQVSQFANVLKSLGVTRGDRVAIYLPLIPELAIAMLACARIGAIHSVVFGGFSSESLRDRINDSQCTLLVTADGGWRRGQVVPLKKMADEALEGTPSIKHVVVVQRLHGSPVEVHVKEGRDHWYHRLMQDASYVCEPERMDAEDMLYILYTSGTTGKPKGIVHTTGGYLVGTYATTKWVFDLKEDDVYWCTADIGWVTGHSYVVYGPLANGATVVMYEGAPDWPEKDRFWQIVERYGVTIFYTAPTAIRAFMRWGTDWPKRRDLTSLRLLGSVGEPINPEAWVWYHRYIGGERCPVVDTWWQTETGAIMITPLPGITTTKPGSATRTFPGISRRDQDRQG
jgi:acetyl-CoA synthetase